MRFSLRNLNCFNYCLYRMLESKQLDPLLMLSQPISFSFEVELPSRDWWIGGNFEQSYHKPEFYNGFKGTWKNIENQEFWEYLKKRIDLDEWIIIQTEWSKVPYSPHYNKRIHDIHSIVINDYDEKNKRLKIIDRMVLNTEIAHNKFEFWVDYSVFENAFKDRIAIFEYEIYDYDWNLNDQIKELLEQSKKNMETNIIEYIPHLHIVNGFKGLDLFLKSLIHYPLEFQNDLHHKKLMNIRIPNCINQHVISNRQMLLSLIIKSDNNDYLQIKKEISNSISSWREMVKITEKYKDSNDSEQIIHSLNKVVETEHNIINAINNWGGKDLQ